MRELIRINILYLCFLFFLFFVTGNVFAFTESSGKNDYAQLLSSDEGGEENDLEESSEEGLKESIFESGGTVIFDKDDDGILNAPPDFGDGGTYPPGGQVNPELPLDDAYPVLLLLVFVYGVIRFFFGKRIKKSKAF